MFLSKKLVTHWFIILSCCWI